MLTIKEAAIWLAEHINRKSFSEHTIRNWIRVGRLPHSKVGGRTFVNESDLEFFLPGNARDNQPAGC